MSLYYKYNFVSPTSLFAEVQDEFDSYFASGLLDDLMFPTWISKALKKLKKSTLDIKDTVLHIDAFQDKLPDNFNSVREAWLCTPGSEQLYTRPTYEYRNCIASAILVSNDDDPACPKCGECDYPDMVQTVYKFTNTDIIRNYGRVYLLKPGNIHTRTQCESYPCANLTSSSPDTFDIHGNKFTVNFREGIVHLIYYASLVDGDGYPLIPDNEPIQSYLELYLKCKLIEKLLNIVTDETVNQLERKLTRYEREKDLAFISARNETIDETIYKKQRAIKRTLNTNRMYEIDKPYYGRYRR